MMIRQLASSTVILQPQSQFVVLCLMGRDDDSSFALERPMFCDAFLSPTCRRSKTANPPKRSSVHTFPRNVRYLFISQLTYTPIFPASACTSFIFIYIATKMYMDFRGLALQRQNFDVHDDPIRSLCRLDLPSRN